MTEDDIPAVLRYKVERLEEEQSRLKEDLKALRLERRRDEERRLKAGIAALGSAVLALGGVIWWMLPPNAQHAWELLRGGNER